ncbi:MAG: KTSC domain-containing protein [Nitrosopumilaceae archaeon]
MNRISVESSNLSSVGYDFEMRVLEIEFHGGGIYQYSNVTESDYNGLMNAESKGKYFAQHIKNKYDYRKVG